jgi:hypothetical protein
MEKQHMKKQSTSATREEYFLCAAHKRSKPLGKNVFYVLFTKDATSDQLKQVISSNTGKYLLSYKYLAVR